MYYYITVQMLGHLTCVTCIDNIDFAVEEKWKLIESLIGLASGNSCYALYKQVSLFPTTTGSKPNSGNTENDALISQFSSQLVERRKGRLNVEQH